MKARLFSVKEVQIRLNLSSPQQVHAKAKRLGWKKVKKSSRTYFSEFDVLANDKGVGVVSLLNDPDPDPQVKSDSSDVKKEKKLAFELASGDEFEYKNVRYTFIRWKRGMKTLVARKHSDGQSWGIKGILPQSQVIVFGNNAPKDDSKSLKKGDLFALEESTRCDLFRYERETQVNVIAVNPISGQKHTIHKGDFKIIKLENLPY